MLSLQKTLVSMLFSFVVTLMITSPALSLEVEYDGIIDPNVIIDLGSPAEGIVNKVFVDRGAIINKGQALVTLKSSIEQAAVKKASALADFDGEIFLQQTQLEFAQRVHDRLKPLNAISVHDKDQAATDVLLTGHRLKKAQENRRLAELELKKAQAILARRTIKSPISGVVVDRYISTGEYVNSQPLLRIAQIDPLKVEVIVPAQMFGKISLGMTAAIVPELSSYGEQTATVTLVDKVIDSASSTFGVRLELPNSKELIPSGQKCLVRFVIDEDSNELKNKTAKVDLD